MKMKVWTFSNRKGVAVVSAHNRQTAAQLLERDLKQTFIDPEDLVLFDTSLWNVRILSHNTEIREMDELSPTSLSDYSGLTITLSENVVRLTCESSKDAEKIFEWLCSHPPFKALQNA